MSKKSLIYLVVVLGLVIGLAVWMHMGGGGALRSWLMEIHGKH